MQWGLVAMDMREEREREKARERNLETDNGGGYWQCGVESGCDGMGEGWSEDG